MTITLNNPLTSPNTAPATSVSPLDESGSSNTKWSKGKKAPIQGFHAQTAENSVWSVKSDAPFSIGMITSDNWGSYARAPFPVETQQNGRALCRL
jgi:hypothetical protein